MPRDVKHRPLGAVRRRDGSVVWRAWAPNCPSLTLVTWSAGGRRETAMTPEPGGYFVHRRFPAEEGLRYALRLPDGGEYPDPASRWQPEGVHRPSAVVLSRDVRLVGRRLARRRPRRTGASTNCTSARSRPRGRSTPSCRGWPICVRWASRRSSSCPWPNSPASATGATTRSILTPCRTVTAGRERCKGSSTPPIAPGWP